MKLSNFREDLEKHEKGTPIYIQDACFWLRRFGTDASNKAVRKIKQSLYGINPDPKEVSEMEVYAHWLIEFGLVDWTGVYDEDNNKLECTARSTRQVFSNDEYWGSGGLVHQLIAEALNYENFLHEEMEEDVEAVKK